MKPFIASDADIFGNEDLNDLLSKQRTIEQRHYKLWLTSSSVLSHIINKPIFERSNFSIEEALSSVTRYVQTSNHLRALEMLEQLHIVIVTGEPGIGKTTLAEHLCLKYVSDGFELVKMSAEIQEAEAVFDSGRPQVFYFDDFLGRNYLEALSGHEGNQIFSFMQRIKRDESKRFILTSRSTILNQGKVLIDNFRNKNVKRNEFELKISSLSELDRARILYSHIWHSNLDAQYVDELYREKRYRTVIDHDNYNPRLIEFITDSTRLEGCAPESYWSHICRTLENPADIWDNAFDAQQDDFGRAIVLLVTLAGRAISQDYLAEAYSRFVTLPHNHTMGGRRDFLFNLRHLTGSLLSRVMENSPSKSYITLFNPSIGDFVLRRYASDLPTLRAAFKSLRSLNSLQTLTSLERNKIVTSRSYYEILEDLLGHSVKNKFVGFQTEYVATIAMELIDADRSAHSDLLTAALGFVKAEGPGAYFHDSARLIMWGRRRRLVDDDSITRFATEACDNNPSKKELDEIFELRDMLPAGEDRKAVTGSVSRAAIEYLEENFDSEIEDDDVFDGLDGDEDDLDEAQEKLRELIEAWLDDRSAEYSSSEIRQVINAFDVESRMHDWLKSNSQGAASHIGHARVDIKELDDGIDDVDDLFDRS